MLSSNIIDIDLKGRPFGLSGKIGEDDNPATLESIEIGPDTCLSALDTLDEVESPVLASLSSFWLSLL